MSKNNTMRKKLNHSKNLKILFITSLFLFLLIALRISWTNFVDIPQGATAKQGTIDLRGIDTSEDFRIKLNGEWAFYPNTFLISDYLEKEVEKRKEIFSNVPETWDTYFENKEDIHYGTYRLQIIKEHNVPQQYGLTIPQSLSPYELYVNGQFIGGLGDLASDNEFSATISRPITHYFTLDSSESELVIQGVHMNRYTKGGITKAIILGDLHSMERTKLFSLMTQITVGIVFIFYFLYSLLLYAIGIREKSLILFSIVVFSALITVLISSNRMLLMYVPLNWIWANKLFYFSYINTMLFFILFLRELVKEYVKSKVLNILSILCIAYLIFIVVAPIEYLFRTTIIYTIIFIVSPMILAITILFIVIKGQKGIVFLLLAATAVANNSLSNILLQKSTLPISHYPFDLLIAITALSGFWFTRYFQTTIQTKELSIKLQKEIERKDDFLANTSHELRNPLHGIMNIAQTLLEKDGDRLQEENKTNLQLLITISNHMSFMLDDLLDLVQLKEKTLHLQKRPINIHSVATGVCDMFRFMLQGKPIELIVKLPKDLPLVIADENRLIQIFSNLIHNAIKFTNEGSITVDAVVINDSLSISIKDTGIGIDVSMQEKIFAPYEQVDPSMTSIGGGLGIGLSICREIITLHGGTIFVSSTIGSGSTFTFTLPISTDTTVKIDEHPASVIGRMNPLPQYVGLLTNYSKFENELAATTLKSQIVTSKPRILVVDDDPINLQILVNVLSAETYEIDTALSGLEALVKLEERHFDLVISDIMMPHMSGYELAKRIRERFSIAELPILFLTARHQREDIYTGFHVGANDYVTKPMEYIELKARVHALIRVKLSSEERLRMEGAWLQAQIQPHFFFNTLSSIISLHHVDEDKMEELLLAFSDYLQTSFAFQNADLVVPIDYELKIVRSYITIEQIRFSERINVIWDIPENIQLLVPPLSIQTLVENAIQHGILMRREGGTVQIRITESEEHFTISIIDNGKGFDSSALKNRKSVGLLNTSQRLKQLFDVELNIDSVLNKGTTISFSIPKNDKKRF